MDNGIPARDLVGLPVVTDLARTRFVADFDSAIAEVNKKMETTFEEFSRTVTAGGA